MMKFALHWLKRLVLSASGRQCFKVGKLATEGSVQNHSLVPSFTTRFMKDTE